jgi:protease secretion system membrane fusion protein
MTSNRNIKMNNSTDAQTLRAIDAEIVDGESLPSDTTRITRFGLWAVGAGFGGFLLWAAFAPLDEGVPSSGVVSVDTKRKAVQHLQGGIVREVLVREGQMVEANQVVIRLDDAVTRSNYESSRQRYLGLRAMEGRLTAEQLGLPAISFHPDLLEAAKSDPLIRQHINAQNQLLQSRRASLAANLAAIDESIKGQQALITGYRGALVGRGNQADLFEREVKGLRDLVAEGYAPFNKQMELERAIADISASTADLQANLARAQSLILELRQRAQLLRADYHKEIDTMMAEVRREVQTEAEKFKSVTEDLARAEIRTPATGQVVGLAIQTVGGVVQAGQKLMDVVPQDEALVLEARVPPHLIDRIHAGSPVDVRFSAFAHSPQLVVDGVVNSISADILTDPVTNAPFYLTRVSLSAEGIKKLGKRQLQPGMPVDVIIRTGERSVLTYLLHPLLRRLSASMKEE